jgi:hypothetical protein
VSTAPAAATASETTRPEGRRRWRRRRWVIATLAVLVAAGAAIAVINPFDSGGRAAKGVVDNGYPTARATVARRSLSSQTNVTATLGYAGTYQVVNQARGGTYTWLPAVGQVVSQGQVLYNVDDTPVVLLAGSTPAYRNLSQGTTGADVTQLNADLVALGYATSSQLDPSSNVFSSATASALEQLQAALGMSQTGTVRLGQAVFLPTDIRVTTVSATLGGPAGDGPVLNATSTTRAVTVDLDAAQQSDVNLGDQVTITLPNNQTTPGVVSSVGTVATTPSSSNESSASSSGSSTPSGGSNSSSSSSSSSGSSSTPTVAVEVTPTDPAATGSLDQAPVQVSITTATVNDALVVPVGALLSQPRGGYAVEVVGPNRVRRLVDVKPGIFDDADGLVQVSSSRLAAGQRVVVPGT